MPENKKPDLQWMSARTSTRHLIDTAEMKALCGEESPQPLKWQEDFAQKKCPQCLSIALNDTQGRPMPENPRPDLMWMTGADMAYRHLVGTRDERPVIVCGSTGYIHTTDPKRAACPRCMSFVTCNVSSVVTEVPGGYNYLPEESEPMTDRIPANLTPNPRVPKRPLLKNPHEEPQTYTLQQVLLIRDYLTPFMRTKSGYSTDPDEKALDELLRSGAFDTDRVLILAAEAEQEKARKDEARQLAKVSRRSPQVEKKNSEPSDEELSAMLDADAKG